MERCKSLARVIKARRAPSWPSPPTLDLPPKEISDTLVDCYLRTTESIYRILHIPTFRRDYDAFWVLNTAPDMVFLVQLKLILAIGAITYDQRFSLRSSAIRWIYEAQTWLSEPKFKARLEIRFLQINLLLLIAQEQVGTGGDSTWISIGALLRKAIHMGLHRDPIHLPQRTAFAAEMRRRLWNTILEIALQSSLAAGGPPLISLDDFDTASPGNFDDDQIVTDDPVPKPSHEFTQVFIAIALRKTFPQRLAITKFLNHFNSSGTYEETLRLDAELRAVYKDLGRTLQACTNSNSGPSPSQFEIRVVDIIMHRFLSSLHLPYFGASFQQTSYAFSRKVVVDSALKIWRAAYSLSPSTAIEPRNQEMIPDSDDMMRLLVCSSGLYPTVAIHAAFIIGAELRAQLQEEESLGPVQLRPDLLTVLEEAKAWTVQVIEAGETSVKGYLLMSVVSAHIEGLKRCLGKDEIAELLLKTAENVVEKSLPMLGEIAAAQGQEDGQHGAANGLRSPPPVDTMEDWNFLVSPPICALNPTCH
jgi:Fungal specific transcription factor domain